MSVGLGGIAKLESQAQKSTKKSCLVRGKEAIIHKAGNENAVSLTVFFYNI